MTQVKLNTTQVFYMNGGGDEQATPRYCVEAMIPHIEHWRGKTIWCPFSTEESQFVKVLREKGFNVVHSHISAGQDFFTYEPAQWDMLIDNPPFTDKRKYMERCEALGKPWSLLLPINIMSDGVINDLFGDMSQLQLLVPNKRTRFINLTDPNKKNAQPTFKAVFFSKGVFTRQIIGVNFPKGTKL